MAGKKNISAKEIEKRIKDLKIELLKNPTKKKSIKKEIARLLTMRNQTKLNGESK
jgi:ribosomal protein L29